MYFYVDPRPSEMGRQGAATYRSGRTGSSRCAMTAPQSHVIQTRSAATPASEIPAAPVLLEEGVE